MSYNKFQYWVKTPRHRKLGENKGIREKIDHGDFDYPNDVLKDVIGQRKALKKKEEEFIKMRLERGSAMKDIEYDMEQVFKKTRVTLRKVEEELHIEEQKRLDAFEHACMKVMGPGIPLTLKEEIFNQVLEAAVTDNNIDSRINNTMDFFNEYMKRLLEEDNKNRSKGLY